MFSPLKTTQNIRNKPQWVPAACHCLQLSRNYWTNGPSGHGYRVWVKRTAANTKYTSLTASPEANRKPNRNGMGGDKTRPSFSRWGENAKSWGNIFNGLFKKHWTWHVSNLVKNCINHQINWFSSPDFWTITWMLFFAGDFLRIVMPWDSSPIRKPTIFFVGHFFPRHTTYLGGGFKYFLCSPLFGVRFPIWLIFFTWVETTN